MGVVVSRFRGHNSVFEDDTFAYSLKTLLATNMWRTSCCINLHDLHENNFSYVFISSGAYLQAMTGEYLPAVKALKR